MDLRLADCGFEIFGLITKFVDLRWAKWHNKEICGFAIMEQSQKLAKKMRFVTVFMLAENLDRKPSRKNGGDWLRLPINRDSGRWQLSYCANVVQKCLLVRSNVLYQVIFRKFYLYLGYSLNIAEHFLRTLAVLNRYICTGRLFIQIFF